MLDQREENFGELKDAAILYCASSNNWRIDLTYCVTLQQQQYSLFSQASWGRLELTVLPS